MWADVTGERDGLADGMKIDTGGYLYTTGPGGVQVFASDATCLGTIYVPQGVTNFTWATTTSAACISTRARPCTGRG